MVIVMAMLDSLTEEIAGIAWRKPPRANSYSAQEVTIDRPIALIYRALLNTSLLIILIHAFYYVMFFKYLSSVSYRLLILVATLV